MIGPATEDSRDRWAHAPALWAALAAYLAALAVLVHRTLLANDGLLIYPLDDTYIGLAIAEEIARGTYGANVGEWSGPASTIVWPFILALFVRLPGAEWAPIALNAVASLAVIGLTASFAARVFASEPPRWRAILVVSTCMITIALVNLLGLTLIGMEHGLQVLVALAAGVGLTGVARGSERHPRLLDAALVLGPLVRYEALALTIPALALLVYLGQRKRAVVVGCTTLALLGAFSLFLLVIDVGVLPGSVVAKRPSSLSEGGLSSLFGNLERQISTPAGLRMCVLGLLVGLGGLGAHRTGAEKGLAAWALVVLALHLWFGGIDYLNRYEIYVWAALLPVAVGLYAGAPQDVATRLGAPRAAAMMLALGLWLAWPYLRDLPLHAAASNDIYTQQYQMHRFLARHHDGPVAVNDIGLTSYRNDRYVLDLMGLSSPEVLRERRRRLDDPAWLDEVTRAHGVDLVMIFDTRDWFPALPGGWVRVARLEQTRPRATTMAWPDVTFFATSSAPVDELRGRLRAFAHTLPAGSRIVLTPDGDGDGHRGG